MKKEEEIYERDAIKDAVQRMSIFSAQLYYHLTKEMVNDYGKEAAMETIKRAIREFGLERGANIRQKCLDSGMEPTIYNLHLNYDMPIAEGWSPESKKRENIVEENEKDVIEDGCTKSCIFADYWLGRDWADIGYLYCAVDDAIREAYNPDILYVPEKNIIKGDDACTAVSSYKK
ncbi:MAG: L-2-amino-thiazoline-4-carboxylic acid hydrolase [Clostridia bacterium]|nr:L-2-amino-thiazoline-4-carboxylic acid hydrolase [Clostridia bacterium]